MKDRKQIIKGIIGSKCGTDHTDVEDNMLLGNDLELDSLDVVELVMELEKEFGIMIPDEEAEKSIKRKSTVLGVITYIDNILGSQVT